MTTLSFTLQENGWHESNWTSDGERHTLVIHRSSPVGSIENSFKASAKVDDMVSVPFFSTSCDCPNDLVFEVDVPQFTVVTFSSKSSVDSAKIS